MNVRNSYELHLKADYSNELLLQINTAISGYIYL